MHLQCSIDALPDDLLKLIVLYGLKADLLATPIEGEFNPQYGSSLAAAMEGIGSTCKKIREIATWTFAPKVPARGRLAGPATLLAEFAAGLAFPDGRTPQQALYDFRAPVAVLECSIRSDTSRPPSEEGTKLLRAAIRDARHGVAAMLLSLPGMDPNQLMDDMGDTLLTAAITRNDHSLTQLLLKQPGIDVRKANTAGQTPIALAMQGFYSLDDSLMQGEVLVELLNTYHSRGHSYSDAVTQDLAQFARSGKDDNVAWILSRQGVIQNCRFFQGPLQELQIRQLNRPYKDCLVPKPAIHAAAHSAEHIGTVVFLLSLCSVGLDLHAQVSYSTAPHAKNIYLI